MSNTEEKTQMYTAQELVWATQLAYCNFNADDIIQYYQDNGEYPTVQELVAQKGYDIFYDYNENKNPTGDSKTMRDETMQFLDDVMGENDAHEVRVCIGWKIVSVKDCQDGSGMYSITIETGEDNAIVASHINGKYLSAKGHRPDFMWHYAVRFGKPLTRGFCQYGLPKSIGSCLHSIQPHKIRSVFLGGDHITRKDCSSKKI